MWPGVGVNGMRLSISIADFLVIGLLSFADYVEKDDFLDLVIDDQFDNSIEAIFHLGACSDTTETNASYLIKNNYEYTKLLAQWATDCDIRFIYASSAATYGDGSAGFNDNEMEIEHLKPLNMYGYNKLPAWNISMFSAQMNITKAICRVSVSKRSSR